MDTSTLLVLLISWISKRFPSLAQYTEYALPASVMIISALGIFTNLLPEPGHKFPVPDIKQLEQELEGSGGMVIKLAKFTRSNVIGINWFIGTIVYKWFYNFTNNLSRFLPSLKKFSSKKS